MILSKITKNLVVDPRDLNISCDVHRQMWIYHSWGIDQKRKDTVAQIIENPLRVPIFTQLVVGDEQ